MTIERLIDTDSWKISDGERSVELSSELLESLLAKDHNRLFGLGYQMKDGRRLSFQMGLDGDFSDDEINILRRRFTDRVGDCGEALDED